MLLEKLNLFSIRSSNVTSLIKTNEQCVTVSCRVIVCKIRGAVDNDIEQFVPKISSLQVRAVFAEYAKEMYYDGCRCSKTIFFFLD